MCIRLVEGLRGGIDDAVGMFIRIQASNVQDERQVRWQIPFLTRGRLIVRGKRRVKRLQVQSVTDHVHFASGHLMDKCRNGFCGCDNGCESSKKPACIGAETFLDDGSEGLRKIGGYKPGKLMDCECDGDPGAARVGEAQPAHLKGFMAVDYVWLKFVQSLQYGAVGEQ